MRQGIGATARRGTESRCRMQMSRDRLRALERAVVLFLAARLDEAERHPRILHRVDELERAAVELLEALHRQGGRP